jgi:APA family basic amino acid/polyamine antiporter
VPLVPALAVVMCTYLMLQLPWVTWIRFAVWLAVGLLVYVVYGVRHSVLRKQGAGRA